MYYKTAAFFVTTLITLGGCQASPAHLSTAGAATSQPAACDKCKTTVQRVPIRSQSRTVGIRHPRRMDCPDCRSAIQNLFAGGEFKHDCNACGPSVEVCDAQ
jgi:hypothetical protein